MQDGPLLEARERVGADLHTGGHTHGQRLGNPVVAQDMGGTPGKAVAVGGGQIVLQCGGVELGEEWQAVLVDPDGAPVPFAADGEELIAAEISAILGADLLHCHEPPDQRLIGALVAEQMQGAGWKFTSRGQQLKQAAHMACRAERQHWAMRGGVGIKATPHLSLP